MAAKKTTVEVEDLYGNKHEVPLGVDGKNPISPDNPSPKAINYLSEDAYARTTSTEGKTQEEVAKEVKFEQTRPIGDNGAGSNDSRV